MRKMSAIVLAGICFSVMFFSPASVKASDAENHINEACITAGGKKEQVKVIYRFDDGSQLLEGQPIVIAQTRGGVTAQKAYHHRNSAGTILWTATVTGAFSYNGSTSSCTNASYDTQINNSSWSEQFGNAYPSGNSAIADVVMARKLLFIVVVTVPVTITLTCDKNGNLS